MKGIPSAALASIQFSSAGTCRLSFLQALVLLLSDLPQQRNANPIVGRILIHDSRGTQIVAR